MQVATEHAALKVSMHARTQANDSVLVDSTNSRALDSLPDHVIVLRECLLQRLLVYRYSVHGPTFVLVETEGQVYSTVQAGMLGVLGRKPRNGSDHLKGRLSYELQCDTHQMCSLDAVMLLKIAAIGVR